MADRIGVINKGELIVVEDKATLMRKLGKKQLTLQLQAPLRARAARRWPTCRWSWPTTATRWSTPSTRRREETGIAALLRRLGEHGIDFKDLHSSESSLEEIFVSLVHAGQRRRAHERATRSAPSTASRWRAPSAR